MDHTHRHSTAEKRDSRFREHYACAGRDMPKPHGRMAERAEPRSDKKWSKELRRPATHSKD